MAIKIKNKGDKEPEDNEELDGAEGSEGAVPPAGQPGGNMDGFERAGFTVAAWIEDNRPIFFTMVGAVIVVALAILLGVLYVRGQQVAASDLVSEGVAAYEHVVEGDPFLDSLREQDNVKEPSQIFESDEAKWQAVYDGGERTLADFDRGPVAVSARMVQASASMNLGNFEDAQELYSQVIDDAEASDEVLAFAHMGLADSLAAQGDVEGAEEAWNGFAELQPDRKAYVDFEVARMLERQGEVDAARQRYEEFVEEYPDSRYLNEVERRQALL